MLKPFFSFYGSKWRVAPKYPTPKYNTIIEPFAGSAGYSIRYSSSNIVLYDIDEKVYGVWEYLIKSSPMEIRKLPTKFLHIDELNIPQEAKWLIGFWLNTGSSKPCKSPSAWMRQGINPTSFWGEKIRERIATQVDKIKHWKVINRSYREVSNERATWFIDAPYIGRAGCGYKHKIYDYGKLAEWCLSRLGQVIVCEQEGATWLPFRPFYTIKSTLGKSSEVIWEN